MKEIKATGEKVCENRKELAEKYFNTFGDGITSVYVEGNMGIVTLLSDLQHVVSDDYWRKILNDIKCILIQDDK